MVNYDNLNKMAEWEREKALFLIKVATDLKMDTTGYGELAVNPNSGYTYLWLEDYNFTLYLPISCELKQNEVYALVTNPEDGEEKEIMIENKNLKELEEWSCKAFEEGE